MTGETKPLPPQSPPLAPPPQSPFEHLPKHLPTPLSELGLIRYRLQQARQQPSRHWRNRLYATAVGTLLALGVLVYFHWHQFRRWKLRERERRDTRKRREGLLSLLMLRYYGEKEREMGVRACEREPGGSRELVVKVPPQQQHQQQHQYSVLMRELMGHTEQEIVDVERWASPYHEDHFMRLTHDPLVRQAVRVDEKWGKLERQWRDGVRRGEKS